MKRTPASHEVHQSVANDHPQAREDLQSLKAEIEKLKADASNNWKKFAAALGIIGGALGVITSTVTLPKVIMETWFVRPQTTIIDGREMTVQSQLRESAASAC